MQDEKSLMEELCETALLVHLRMEKLAALLPHTPGCIVWKGKRKEYPYWQIRKNRKQLHKYVRVEQLPAVEEHIRKMKMWLSRLRELKRFFKKLKRALRAFGVTWDSVLDMYEKKRLEKQAADAQREAAQAVAAEKAYSGNYRHMTDKGDMVASKSEEIIGNTLFAMNVPYEYEKPFVLTNGREVKPDFTVWRPDGTMLLWEHVGLPEDRDYMAKHEWKMREYEKCGFTRSKNLILTFDEKGTLSAAEVRRMIELYRLV